VWGFRRKGEKKKGGGVQKKNFEKFLNFTISVRENRQGENPRKKICKKPRKEKGGPWGVNCQGKKHIELVVKV